MSVAGVAWLLVSSQALNVAPPPTTHNIAAPPTEFVQEHGAPRLHIGLRRHSRSPTNLGSEIDEAAGALDTEEANSEGAGIDRLSQPALFLSRLKEMLPKIGSVTPEKRSQISDPFGFIACSAIVLICLAAAGRKLMRLHLKAVRYPMIVVPEMNLEIDRLKLMRREPRYHTTFRYGVIYDGYVRVANCTIVDRSDHGARIRTAARLRDGDQINFLDESEMFLYAGRVAWRKGNEAGLELRFTRRMKLQPRVHTT